MPTMTAEPTRKGYALAARLADEIGYTRAIAQTCSLIARHATTYEGIQVRWCNDEMSERATARLEARETATERRIAALVGRLPDTDAGPWAVRFDGDPRGYVVTLVAPDGRTVGVA